MKKILFGLFVAFSLLVVTFITLHKGEEKSRQHALAHRASIKHTEEAWLKIQAAEPALTADYLETTSESAKIEKRMEDQKLFMNCVFTGFVLSMMAVVFLAVCTQHEWNGKRITESEELSSDV